MEGIPLQAERVMLALLWILLRYPFSFFRARHDLALEVLALRDQLMVLKRQAGRPSPSSAKLGITAGRVIAWISLHCPAPLKLRIRRPQVGIGPAVGVGGGQFGLALSAQPMHGGDDADRAKGEVLVQLAQLGAAAMKCGLSRRRLPGTLVARRARWMRSHRLVPSAASFSRTAASRSASTPCGNHGFKST